MQLVDLHCPVVSRHLPCRRQTVALAQRRTTLMVRRQRFDGPTGHAQLVNIHLFVDALRRHRRRPRVAVAVRHVIASLPVAAVPVSTVS